MDMEIETNYLCFKSGRGMMGFVECHQKVKNTSKRQGGGSKHPGNLPEAHDLPTRLLFLAALPTLLIPSSVDALFGRGAGPH
jgi:hypothetical protein